MKIGLVIYGTLATPSGGYLYDQKVIEFLERQGDQVEIVSLPWRNYARHMGDNLSTDLLKRLAGLRVDILLEDELNHPSLFWLNYRLRRRINYPIVSIVHHLRCSEARQAWQNRFYKWVERRYLASLDGFIFNSRTTRLVVEGLLGCERCPPAIVAYPAGDRFGVRITEEEIDRRARQTGPLRLVFVGNLIPRKNLHSLVEALGQLPPGGWELSIAGSAQADPAYARSVREQVVRSGWTSRVHFMGHLAETALAGLLQASHLLAVPSSYEGFGIAYLEGMSFGLPAIASKAGAAREIIIDGENGFLVEPGDVQGLAACLNTLIQGRSRLASMGQAALRRYQQHPTWDESAAAIRAFLHSQISGI